MTPQELLLRAVDLIERQGHMPGPLAHGWDKKPCDPHSAAAYYFTACGAIQRARQPDGWVDALDAEGMPQGRPWIAETKKAAVAAIGKLGPLDAFFEWEATATKVEVIAKLREVAS